jgi:hypothetical protein
VAIAIFVAYAIALYMWLAVNVKRCHDRGHSGWFVLLGLIPLVNIWYVVEVCFLPGQRGANRFGPDPKATTLGPMFSFPRHPLSMMGRRIGRSCRQWTPPIQRFSSTPPEPLRGPRASGTHRSTNARRAEFRRIPAEPLRRPKCAKYGEVVSDTEEASGYAQRKVNRQGPNTRVGHRCWACLRSNDRAVLGNTAGSGARAQRRDQAESGGLTKRGRVIVDV